MTYFLKKYEDINMIKVNDKSKLNYYIKKFAINEIFTENIEDNMELHYFKKGSHICTKGEILDYFYFFVKLGSTHYL